MQLNNLTKLVCYARLAGFTTLLELGNYMRCHKLNAQQFINKVKSLEYLTINGKFVGLAELDAFYSLVRNGSIRTKLAITDGCIQYKGE